jgi:uncharacterized damage-inducible protein DinB
MTYYGAKELAESFLTVRKNTIIIAEEIDEKNYGFRPTPEARSIGQTIAHITNALKLPEHIHGTLKLKTLEGFNFPQFFMSIMEDEKKEHTKPELLTRLTEGGNSFAHWLGSLSEEFLAERVSMPPGMNPPNKTRFEMLLGVKEHEMHHRAQLMLLQRMTGGVSHLTRQMNERMAAMMAAQKQSA